MPTTAGSYRHRDRVSEDSCPVHEVFRDAGAVLVGKTSLSDMGLGPESTNYLSGSVRNPHDLRRTAGGSSGGAAAAVADGMQAFDWGTDTGGSIRQPAAFCGVLGMRLSSRTWPIERVFPLLPEPIRWLCGQGPIARTTLLMRQVLETAAPKLRTGPSSGSFTLKGTTIYAPTALGSWPTFEADVLPHVDAAWEGPVELRSSLPCTTKLRRDYTAVWCSHLRELATVDESMSWGETIRAVLSSVFFRGLFGDRRYHPSSAELLALMWVGSMTIFRNRKKALQRAREIREQYERVWDRGHVVVSPVCVDPAPRVGRTNRNKRIFDATWPGNIADTTALTVPFGHFEDGLPRGVQFQGPPGSEFALLDLADRFIDSRDKDAELRVRPIPSDA